MILIYVFSKQASVETKLAHCHTVITSTSSDQPPIFNISTSVNTSPHAFGDIKFSIASNQINNNFALFLLHCVNVGFRNTLKSYKTKNKKRSGESNLKTSFSIQHVKHNFSLSFPPQNNTVKTFCRKHMYVCYLKCFLWRAANFHLCENINEIFRELKNLVKHKNCIITKCRAVEKGGQRGRQPPPPPPPHLEQIKFWRVITCETLVYLLDKT